MSFLSLSSVAVSGEGGSLGRVGRAQALGR